MGGNDQSREFPIHASVSDDERRDMIAAGAWFRSRHRGFEQGDPVTDWLDAEAEVDGSVQRRSAEQRWAEYEADRRLRWTVADRLNGSETSTTGQILAAIDEVAEEMASSGEYEPHVVRNVATTFRKDLANWAEHGTEPDERPGMLVGRWQERGQVFLEQARSRLDEWRERILKYLDDHRSYHSGEVVAPGGFSCLNCGTRQEMADSGHLRPCRHCYHTRFQRIWKL